MTERVIAIVPARSGSKGFPNKNLARIGGRTLLELAVLVARDARCVDEVYVSTDSAEYERVAFAAGARSAGLRPAELSGDSVKTSTVVVALLRHIGMTDGIVVLLQPTSPMRSPDDVDAVVEMMRDERIDAVATVERLHEPHPAKVKRRDQNGLLHPYVPGASSETPRQELPEAFRLSGAIYAVRVPVLIEQQTFLPPRTYGHPVEPGVNIDREEDFLFLETLVKSGRVRLHGIKED